MRRSEEPELTVIWWGDIPSHVIAQRGRVRVKAELPHRFTKAVDQAAMRAGLETADEYLAGWVRRSRPCGPDLQAEVDAEVAALDERYPRSALLRLIRALPSRDEAS